MRLVGGSFSTPWSSRRSGEGWPEAPRDQALQITPAEAEGSADTDGGEFAPGRFAVDGGEGEPEVLGGFTWEEQAIRFSVCHGNLLA